jgi:hypothetical protein
MAMLDRCGVYTLVVPEGYRPAFISESMASQARNVIKPWSLERLTAKWVPECRVPYVWRAPALIDLSAQG